MDVVELGAQRMGSGHEERLFNGPSQTYLKWYLLEIKRKREAQVRRGLGLGMGKH